MNPHYIIFGIFLITLFSTLFVMFTKIALEEYLKADESELKPMGTKTCENSQQLEFNTWANYIHSHNRTK